MIRIKDFINYRYSMNKVYLYDGSLDSLLILIASLFYLNIKPDDIKSELDYETNLIDEFNYLNLTNKDEIFKHFKSKISLKVMRTVYYIFLSNDDRKELVIYYFIKNAFMYGNEIYYRRNLNCVNSALKISQYVSRESHKLKGFLRFKELKNEVLYAEMAPTNNILVLLMEHFKKRFSCECFVIKDTRRNIFGIYNKNRVYYLESKDILNMDIEMSEREENFEKLWKLFFNHIGIKERENKRTQMSFMPKKYWDYIIEMDGVYEEDNKRE